MKWLKRLAYLLAGLYLLVAALLYFKQEALIFHPRVRSADHRYGDHAEEWIPLADGTRLHALHLRGGGRGVILYLHGNKGDNGRSLYQTRALRDFGYDLYLVDYRGYGKSEGTTSTSAHLTTDLQAVYDRLAEAYGEAQLLLLGYSLGSGPASYLAANNNPRATVLVAPYTSLEDMKNQFLWMFPDFLLKYDVDNAARLAQAAGPVYVVHGTDDELIPLAMGRRLAGLRENIHLIELAGTGHRGAILHRQVPYLIKQLTAE